MIGVVGDADMLAVYLIPLSLLSFARRWALLLVLRAVSLGFS